MPHSCHLSSQTQKQFLYGLYIHHPTRMASNTSDPNAITTTPATAGSRLFKLPDKVRNKIYRYVLIKEDAIAVVRSNFQYRTALLKVCRQICNDAATIFYSENAFKTDFAMDQQKERLEDIFSWLAAIGPERAALIERLTVQFTLSEKSKQAVHDIDETIQSTFGTRNRMLEREVEDQVDAARDLPRQLGPTSIKMSSVTVVLPQFGTRFMTENTFFRPLKNAMDYHGISYEPTVDNWVTNREAQPASEGERMWFERRRQQ